jgi:hypothetical protein
MATGSFAEEGTAAEYRSPTAPDGSCRRSQDAVAPGG